MRMFDVMVLQSFIMQHMTVSIQVNHVTKYKYSPWNNKLNIFLLANTGFLYAKLLSIEDYHVSNSFTKVNLFVTVVAQWHYILNVIHEMSNALSIRIFCVKDKS